MWLAESPLPPRNSAIMTTRVGRRAGPRASDGPRIAFIFHKDGNGAGLKEWAEAARRVRWILDS